MDPKAVIMLGTYRTHGGGGATMVEIWVRQPSGGRFCGSLAGLRLLGSRSCCPHKSTVGKILT